MSVRRPKDPGRLARLACGLSVAVWLWAGLALAQDARSLARQAYDAYAAKRYAESVALFRRAIEAGGKSPETFYTAACSAALAGDRETAFAWLEEAVRRGYRDLAPMKADPDLASLRADARWAALLAKVQKNREAYLGTVNAEILEMYEQDQADRTGPIESLNWAEVSKRDAARRERVRAMLTKGELKVGDDYFHAAMVMQHGDKPEDYALARDLASKAAELNPELRSARWLAAAAEDRYLWSIGKPQVYGTQFTKQDDGPWTIEPIDEKAVTDEERLKAGVPTLAETRARLAAMNEAEGKKAP
jgi:tetratricopeptide (TPR) repeat protein